MNFGESFTNLSDFSMIENRDKVNQDFQKKEEF